MEYKNLKELKNKHKGEDIWIILAGSSMDYVSKDFFENKIVVGQNQIFKHYPCDYIIMKDCMEEPRFPRSIKQCDKLGIPLIFSKGYKGYYDKERNEPQHSNAYSFDHNPRRSTFDYELENLGEDEIIVSRSSVTSMIHIAAYLGAKNIILCGHDCGTLDGNLYYDGYIEKDWISAGNWSGINEFMSKIELQSQKVRQFLMDKYDCNIHSLNPFLNLGLEGHKYEAS